MVIEWNIGLKVFPDERPRLWVVAQDDHGRYSADCRWLDEGGSLFQFVMDTAVMSDAAFRKYPPIKW